MISSIRSNEFFEFVQPYELEVNKGMINLARVLTVLFVVK